MYEGEGSYIDIDFKGGLNERFNNYWFGTSGGFGSTYGKKEKPGLFMVW